MTTKANCICPHCGASGITAKAKTWSSATSPAACSACGGLSYVPTTGFDSLVALLSFPLGIAWLMLALLGLACHPMLLVIPFVLAPLGLFFLHHYFRSRAQLRVTTAARSRRSRILFYICFAAFILAMIICGLTVK